MDLTRLQLSELICRHPAKENGLYDLPEIIIESMMVAERSEFWLIIRIIRGTVTDPVPLMATAENLSSASPGTGMVTSIFGYWPYCAIRRSNATGSQERYISRDYAGAGIRSLRPDIRSALLQGRHKPYG